MSVLEPRFFMIVDCVADPGSDDLAGPDIDPHIDAHEGAEERPLGPGINDYAEEPEIRRRAPTETNKRVISGPPGGDEAAREKPEPDEEDSDGDATISEHGVEVWRAVAVALDT